MLSFPKILHLEPTDVCNLECPLCARMVDSDFNPDYPEYHNVYISSMKDKYAMMYDGHNWNLVMKKDLIDKIYDDNKNYIERLRQKPSSFTEMEKANDLYFDLNTKKMAGEALTPTEENILSNIESRMQGGYSTRQPSEQQKTNEIDPVMQQAMQVIQKYPNKKDEVNKRLISVGKQPIP